MFEDLRDSFWFEPTVTAASGRTTVLFVGIVIMALSLFSQNLAARDRSSLSGVGGSWAVSATIPVVITVMGLLLVGPIFVVSALVLVGVALLHLLLANTDRPFYYALLLAGVASAAYAVTQPDVGRLIGFMFGAGIFALATAATAALLRRRATELYRITKSKPAYFFRALTPDPCPACGSVHALPYALCGLGDKDLRRTLKEVDAKAAGHGWPNWLPARKSHPDT